MNLFRNTIISFSLLMLLGSFNYKFAKGKEDEVNERWQKSILAAVDSFPEKGGYYTGRKVTPDFPKSAWRAFNEAFKYSIVDSKPEFQQVKAQPSFCSLATYGAFIKALLIYDNGNIKKEVWYAMKPYMGIVDGLNQVGYNQNDGEGCWGRWNANGPGSAVLINEVKAGFNFTAYRGAKSKKNKETKDEKYLTDEEWRANDVWNRAIPGDIMKIFWNRNESAGSDSGAIIGCNDNESDDQEHGHSVVFLGYTTEGLVKYWSSNGPSKTPKEDGYGIKTCDKTAIQRVVFSRITKPENFNNAKSIMYNNSHKWLSDLNGKKHGTTAELKKYCGIK